MVALRPSVSVWLFFYSPDWASIAAAQGIRCVVGAPVKRFNRVGPVEVVRDVEVRETRISPLVQVVLEVHGRRNLLRVKGDVVGHDWLIGRG